jgi:hypothetical protein
MINQYGYMFVPGTKTLILVGEQSHILSLGEEPVSQILAFISDLNQGDPQMISCSREEEEEGVRSKVYLFF